VTNRIDQLSASVPAARQTPNDDFGAMFARGLSRSTAMAGTASAIIPGGAVLSAAIRGTVDAALQGATGRDAVGGGGAGAGAQGAQSATTVAGGSDELSGQRDLMRANQQWSEQYLGLQMQMQQESREFTAISNILKVRHESAKTAINNVR
jgi:hypothetical protein